LRDSIASLPGYCGAQDTFYVGNLTGIARIYQQTFVDTYSKVGFCQSLFWPLVPLVMTAMRNRSNASARSLASAMLPPSD
jgi:hypothetical protein